ncbi:MAG: Do family serine endopeptidase [Gammaproteobacteria bacterium]|nr:Do family serine endopeptidase [Gammaproteobacteria bacterium]
MKMANSISPGQLSGSPHKILRTSLALCFIAVILLANSAPASLDSSHAAADLGKVNVNDGFSELVEAVKPTVVNISVTGSVETSRQGPFGENMPFDDFFRRFFEGVPEMMPDQNQAPNVRKTMAVGSGFIVDPDGLVVTNHHVIADADSIEVVLHNGTRIPATVKGTDERTDLALLEVETNSPLPYAKFGDSDAAKVGDWVVAIGNPFGFGGTTTSGIISARGRDIQQGSLLDFIQIDASINRGNSGGPLFNIRGEVIGVNNAIYSPTGGNVGIGFAIPSSTAREIINQLKSTGIVERGFLGVLVQSLNEDLAESFGLEGTEGALVAQVNPDSPAEMAGIRVGDIIVKFDGKPVDSPRSLARLVSLTSENSKVVVTLWRDNAEVNVFADIGNLQASNGEPETPVASVSMDKIDPFGMSVRAITEQDKQDYNLGEDAEGVIIVEVEPDGIAAQNGLVPGYIIQRVGNKEVLTVQDLRSQVEQLIKDGQNSILMLVQRFDGASFITLSLS